MIEAAVIPFSRARFSAKMRRSVGTFSSVLISSIVELAHPRLEKPGFDESTMRMAWESGQADKCLKVRFGRLAGLGLGRQFTAEDACQGTGMVMPEIENAERVLIIGNDIQASPYPYQPTCRAELHGHR